MCVKCLRKSKRLGLPKFLTYGQIKVYAHRLLSGQPIPLFGGCKEGKKAFYAIEAHVHKIEQARTKKRKFKKKFKWKEDF